MDDETLACGGMLAGLPDKSNWHVLYATNGAKNPEPDLLQGERSLPGLGAIRREEALKALTLLGIPSGNIHFHDLPDGSLRRHQRDLIKILDAWIAKLRPDHLLAPFQYDRHPDHIALHHAALHAALNANPQPVLTEYFTYLHWRTLPRRDIRLYLRPEWLYTVNIEPVAHRKRAALDSFTSQTTCFLPWQTRPVLSPALLDDVSHAPECFLRRDPQGDTAPVFTHAAAWIKLAHRVEPLLKRVKNRLTVLMHPRKPNRIRPSPSIYD